MQLHRRPVAADSEAVICAVAPSDRSATPDRQLHRHGEGLLGKLQVAPSGRQRVRGCPRAGGGPESLPRVQLSRLQAGVAADTDDHKAVELCEEARLTAKLMVADIDLCGKADKTSQSRVQSTSGDDARRWMTQSHGPTASATDQSRLGAEQSRS